MGESYPPDAKEHLAVAARKLDAMRQRAQHAPSRHWTLTGMIEDWRDLVEQIEEGYDDNVYEYTNDLSLRDLLDELLAVIPEGSVRGWVTREIEEVDVRYRDATRPTNKPIFRSADAPWSWQRVPKVLAGELAADLKPDLSS